MCVFVVDRRQYILFSRPAVAEFTAGPDFSPARLMRRHFNPGLWPTLATVVLFILLTRLGFWQLQRADEKQELQQRYQAQMSAEPVNLGQVAGLRDTAELMHWRRCRLAGTYDPGTIYLLDNQVMRGVVGYQVFTRVVLEDGASVLADRGWIAAPGTRNEAPHFDTTPGPLTLTGVAKPAPVGGIRLAGDIAESLGDNLQRVQRIDLARIAARNGWALLPYVVRLDPGAAGVLTWNGSEPGFRRERHLGYAFQWFALAATLLVIYLVVNLRKRTGAEDN